MGLARKDGSWREGVTLAMGALAGLGARCIAARGLRRKVIAQIAWIKLHGSRLTVLRGIIKSKGLS